MAEKDSFADLMDRLRSGEDAAAREVFERFARRLAALARRRYGAALRHRLDSEEVVQSAYKSFFLRHREGKLRVESWDGLWGLLTLITLRKCSDRAEYFRAGKRDMRREVIAEAGPGEGDSWREGIDREPTPHEAAVLRETVEQLLRELPESQRPIVQMSLQGYTAQEISQQLGRAERSVRRLREQVRLKLERLQEET
jgi:RNA polymerase sigma-70 factor (ECF subfamily)